MLDAFIIEQIKHEREREEWQPIYLTLEIEEDNGSRKNDQKQEKDRIVIRF